MNQYYNKKGGGACVGTSGFKNRRVRYVMDLRSGKEPEVTPKAKLYFAVGKALEPVIMENAGYDPKLLLGDRLEVRVPVNGGVVLTGHPDALDEDGKWVIECKTMRDFAYRKMIATSFFLQFPQYLVQGAVYAKGTGAEGVIYLCLNKDASEIHRVRVEAWELEDYWKTAVENAELIQQWKDKKNLPGNAVIKGQPPFWCHENYCLRHFCRYNFINRRLYFKTK